MVHELVGEEEREAVLVVVALLLLLVLLVLLVERDVAEVGSRWDLVEAGLPACSSPCCMRNNNAMLLHIDITHTVVHVHSVTVV